MRITRHKLLVLTVGVAALCCLVEAQTARRNGLRRIESHTARESSDVARFEPCQASGAAVRHYGSPKSAFSTTVTADDLCFVVGQPVTLRGIFSLRGKLGPFVTIGDRQVYLIAGGSFSWGREYKSMEGNRVTISGTLRFFKAPPVREGPIAEARSPDHYYMEAESARVELVK